MQVAIRAGRCDTVGFLLQEGAMFGNIARTFSMATAAAASGDAPIKLLRLLLRHLILPSKNSVIQAQLKRIVNGAIQGVPVNGKFVDAPLLAALNCCGSKEQFNTIHFLLEHGAKPHVTNEKGESSLFFAACDDRSTHSAKCNVSWLLLVASTNSPDNVLIL